MKNDTLRRRYDSLKYDLKKIEEGNNESLSLQERLLTRSSCVRRVSTKAFWDQVARVVDNELGYKPYGLLSGGGSVFVFIFQFTFLIADLEISDDQFPNLVRVFLSLLPNTHLVYPGRDIPVRNLP